MILAKNVKKPCMSYGNATFMKKFKNEKAESKTKIDFVK